MTSLTGIVAVMLILSNCLQANPLKQPIGELARLSKKLDNITFTQAMQLYTPEDVKEQCFKEALECFREELKTVKYKRRNELGEEDLNTLYNFDQLLTRMSQRMKTSESPDQCSCEANQELLFQTFKKKLVALIYQVTSHYTAQATTGY